MQRNYTIKRILIRSKGAMTDLATIPARPPEIKLLVYLDLRIVGAAIMGWEFSIPTQGGVLIKDYYYPAN